MKPRTKWLKAMRASPAYQDHVRAHEAREHASIGRISDERARTLARRELAHFDARDIRKAEAIAAGRKPRMGVQHGPLARRYTAAFESLIKKFQGVYRRRRNANVRHRASR